MNNRPVAATVLRRQSHPIITPIYQSASKLAIASESLNVSEDGVICCDIFYTIHLLGVMKTTTIRKLVIFPYLGEGRAKV
jgi:hypothetical protein